MQKLRPAITLLSTENEKQSDEQSESEIQSENGSESDIQSVEGERER